jgi:Type II secretion system (T2SS), protein F
VIVMAVMSGALVGGGLAALALPSCSRRVVEAIAWVARSSGNAAHVRTQRLHAADLSIADWTTTDLVFRQLVSGMLGVFCGGVAGSRFDSVIAILVVGTLGGFAGFVLPSAMLRSRARSRRRDFLHAFSAYLDLVNVLLETALVSAAEAGDGWAFKSIRGCLVRARLSRRSPWTELRLLGARWDLSEVVEVAGSMHLSGDHGARIRQSLGARADSLRARQLAQIEASAQSSTERMGVPMMLLFVGFMVLLGYPALQTVVMNM